MIQHPFEKAGLGIAPFRCVGVERKIGPIKSTDPKFPGVTFEVGAPGQPMGTCDYCGTGIADCYRIKSSDGKTFVVGSDCVARTYKEVDMTVPSDVRNAIAKIAREKREARADARREKLAAQLKPLRDEARKILAERPELFTGEPHPAISGKTLRDYYEFLLQCAGDARRVAICKTIIEKGR